VTLWTRRAIVVLLACSGPTILFLLSVKPLLVNVLGRTVEQATQTATFCSVIAISVPILCVFHVQIKFLQVRNQMKVPLVVMAVGNVTNVVFNYILISAYGLVGAAFSTVFSRLVQLLLAWAFIAYDQRSLPRKDRLMAGFLVPAELAAAVEWAGIKQYLKTGIAGGFMIGLETWGFDIAVLMASRLGDVSLNAHVILLSASAFTFVTFPLAVATAATIRAGNMLGAGKPRTARMASILCLSASVAAMSIMGVFLLAFRTVLGRAVSVDPEVIEKVASATHIIALFQIADGFQGTAAGVLRGVGKHHIVAVVNFIGFWGLGLPMCYFLAFSRGMGLQGLWWGHFAGISAVAAVHAFVFTTVDWDKEARIAVEQSSVPIEAEFNELELEEM
jgi:MATE family multidrug resistance protein